VILRDLLGREAELGGEGSALRLRAAVEGEEERRRQGLELPIDENRRGPEGADADRRDVSPCARYRLSPGSENAGEPVARLLLGLTGWLHPRLLGVACSGKEPAAIREHGRANTGRADVDAESAGGDRNSSAGVV
jgi:hypothetical protein